MAKTFNVDRVLPGTIELVRANDGTYSSRVVGLETINSLSLPDISTSNVAAATKTDTETKTATDITGDTIQKQTQLAFKTSDRDNNQPDTTGDMLQEAQKTSSMLSDTFADARQKITTNDAYTGITAPLEIKEADERISAKEAAPQEDIGTDSVTDFKSYQDAILRGGVGTKAVGTDLKGSAAVQTGEAEPPGFNFDFLKGDKFKEISSNRPSGIDAPMKESMTRDEMISGATPDDFTANQLGITTTKPEKTALDMDRFKGVSEMGALTGDEKKDVKPVKINALETVSTSLRSAFKNIKTPMMMVVDAITPDITAVNNHDTSYFTDRGDGRIGGNPSTDLYAGMNRVSAFGNLEKAGEKRIERREKTISKKGYGPGDKFYDDTQNMKDQQNNYKSSLDKNVTTKREAARMNQPGSGGDTSGRSGGKIVCTMMNESYGFGSFRNKIWLRHSKNLAPEYQIGYHRIFLPLVKKAKTNKVLKKILEHIAIHRTIDIRQEERNKIHLLGRVYRTILEPICYWVGKI